jgi:hypothetical protein
MKNLTTIQLLRRRERRHAKRHPMAFIDPGAANTARVMTAYASRLMTGRNRAWCKCPALI